METAIFAGLVLTCVVLLWLVSRYKRLGQNSWDNYHAVCEDRNDIVLKKRELQSELAKVLEESASTCEAFITLKKDVSQMLVAAGLEHVGIAGVATAVKQYRNDVSELAAELKRAEAEVAFRAKRADAIAAELAAANQDRFKEVAMRLACEKELAARFEDQQKQEAKLLVDYLRLVAGYRSIVSVLGNLTANGALPREAGDDGKQEVASMDAEGNIKFHKFVEDITSQTPKEESDE